MPHSRTVSVSLVLALVLVGASPAQEKAVSVVNYNVKSILGKRLVFRDPERTPAPIDNIGDVTRLIVTSVDPKGWLGDRFSIEELDGEVLVVRTTPANQKKIASILEALDLLAKPHVLLETELVSVEKKQFEKMFRAQLDKADSQPVGLDENDEAKLRKVAKRLRSTKTILARTSVRALSLRKAIVYEWMEVLDAKMSPRIAYASLDLTARALISTDRRFVRLWLTQSGARFSKMVETKRLDVNLQEVVLKSPRLVESSLATMSNVADGTPLMFPALIPPPNGIAKDRIAVFLVRPLIIIPEEEQLRKFGLPATDR